MKSTTRTSIQVALLICYCFVERLIYCGFHLSSYHFLRLNMPHFRTGVNPEDAFNALRQWIVLAPILGCIILVAFGSRRVLAAGAALNLVGFTGLVFYSKVGINIPIVLVIIATGLNSVAVLVIATNLFAHKKANARIALFFAIDLAANAAVLLSMHYRPVLRVLYSWEKGFIFLGVISVPLVLLAVAFISMHPTRHVPSENVARMQTPRYSALILYLSFGGLLFFATTITQEIVGSQIPASEISGSLISSIARAVAVVTLLLILVVFTILKSDFPTTLSISISFYLVAGASLVIVLSRPGMSSLGYRPIFLVLILLGLAQSCFPPLLARITYEFYPYFTPIAIALYLISMGMIGRFLIPNITQPLAAMFSVSEFFKISAVITLAIALISILLVSRIDSLFRKSGASMHPGVNGEPPDADEPRAPYYGSHKSGWLTGVCPGMGWGSARKFLGMSEGQATDQARWLH